MEDFVTFEQAVRLKELGFDWITANFYDLENPQEGCITGRIPQDWNVMAFITLASAPTLAQAQKWLREVKDVILVANIKFHKGKVKYSWYIVTDNGDRGICDDIEKSIFDTYEQALSAGINKAIELLK